MPAPRRFRIAFLSGGGPQAYEHSLTVVARNPILSRDQRERFRRLLITLCLASSLLLCSLPAAVAQSEKQAKAQPKEWLGTWSASGGSGPLSGTWTATEGDSPYVAYGTWAVLDASGKAAASGTWSANKAEKTWGGGWQARIGNSAATFAGTWTARSPIVSPATLMDMFEFAITNIATGEWHLGPPGKPVRSGGWSIRAYQKR